LAEMAPELDALRALQFGHLQRLLTGSDRLR
jgi:hypothetical protein